MSRSTSAIVGDDRAVVLGDEPSRCHIDRGTALAKSTEMGTFWSVGTWSSGTFLKLTCAGLWMLAGCRRAEVVPTPDPSFTRVEVAPTQQESTTEGPVAGTGASSWSVQGTADNLTAASTAGVKLNVVSTDGKTYSATGAFDNVSLFGTFDLYGRTLPRCRASDVCLQFAGALKLGDMGGWPTGTQSSYVMTLVLNPKTGKGRGVYVVGPLPGMDYEQHGLLDVTVR